MDQIAMADLTEGAERVYVTLDQFKSGAFGSELTTEQAEKLIDQLQRAIIRIKHN